MSKYSSRKLAVPRALLLQDPYAQKKHTKKDWHIADWFRLKNLRKSGDGKNPLTPSFHADTQCRGAEVGS